jgi:hypothetical protein
VGALRLGNTVEDEIDNPHTHAVPGGPASWPTATADPERNQHFHINNGLGQPMWTGPRYPNFVYTDSHLPVP